MAGVAVAAGDGNGDGNGVSVVDINYLRSPYRKMALQAVSNGF